MPVELASQIGEARNEGYSDDEIVGYLGTARTDLAPKLKEARDSGYKASEILDFLKTYQEPQLQPHADAMPPMAARDLDPTARKGQQVSITPALMRAPIPPDLQGPPEPEEDVVREAKQVGKAGLKNLGEQVSASGPLLTPEYGGVATTPPTAEQTKKFGEAMGKPLVPLTAALPPETGHESIGRAITRGLAGGLESFTSPEQLALLAATEGTGALSRAALAAKPYGYGAAAIRAANIAAATAFGGQAAYGAGKELYEAGKEALANGDLPAAAKHFGFATVDGLMAYLGLRHLKGAVTELKQTPIPRGKGVGGGAEAAPSGAPQITDGPVIDITPEQPGGVPGQPAKPPKPTQTEIVTANTPNAPTAAEQTVAESPETLAIQLQQLVDGTRRVVMFPKGTPAPDQAPPNTMKASDKFGNTYLFRPDLISRPDIQRAAKNNALTQILGHFEQGLGAPDKSLLTGPVITVVVRDANGTEVQSTATDQAHLPVTLAAHEGLKPPGGTVTVEPVEGVVGERAGAAPGTPAATTEETLEGPQDLEKTEPEIQDTSAMSGMSSDRVNVSDGPNPNVDLLRETARQFPVLDAQGKPTGWFRLADATVLIHPTENRIINFQPQDTLSVTDLARARDAMYDFATKNRVTPAEGGKQLTPEEHEQAHDQFLREEEGEPEPEPEPQVEEEPESTQVEGTTTKVAEKETEPQPTITEKPSQELVGPEGLDEETGEAPEPEKPQEEADETVRPDGIRIFAVPHSGIYTLIAVHPDQKEGKPDDLALLHAGNELKRRGFNPENIVGTATFSPHGLEKAFSATYVEVDPAWRRRGIASSLYKHAEQVTGGEIIPSKGQTTEGKAFSDARTGKNLEAPAAIEPEKKPEETDGGLERIEPEEEKAPELAGPQALEPQGAPGLVEAVYQKLERGESLGNVTELTKLAEQHFGSSRTSGEWTPKDMFDAMEAGINKYLIKHGAELMRKDAVEGLRELRGLMERITSQGVRTDEQIKKQQFSTPPTEGYLAAKVAGVKADDVMLEPSAGNGGLAVFAKSIGAEVHVNEIAPRRVEMLKAVGFKDPSSHDGEILHSLLDQKIKPTVIIMNPPFSAGVVKSHEAKNRNVYGFNHVDSALQRLEPGGRLVAILGGGKANDPTGGANLYTGPSGKWFDKIGNYYNVRANIRISGKEYQKYGTTFATRLIVIDKDGPTPYDPANGRSAASRWMSVVQGNVDTLEQAYELLKPVAESRPAVSARPGGRTGTRQGQPGTGVAPGASAGAPSGGAGVQGQRGAEAEGQLPSGSPQPDGGVGGDEPSTGNQPTPLREPRLQPADDSEGAPTQDAGGGSKVSDAERPLPSPATVEKLDIEQAEEEEPAEEDTEAYVSYRPSIKGPEHPGNIVETKTMATVPLPSIIYKPALPASVIDNGLVSAVQLEAISLAGQQNDIILPGGFRGSALIGDGTGVGKGRIAAGILWDNYRKGRKRLVWVSEKWDLMQDAMRDLSGLGAEELMRGITQQGGKFVVGKNAGVIGLNKFKGTADIKHDGVLFTTYSMIRSEDKKGNRRIAQLERYLRGDDDGEGAYILFDESHNLKNAVTTKGKKASQTGVKVKELLQSMPPLRTVSLSATAATEVVNLGYLDRLGLWGPGTAFPNGFQEFQNQVGPGGLAAMEMIARELKAQGKYMSRTLSYKGVTFNEAEHKLSKDQKELYRTAVKAWQKVVDRAEDTIKNTTNGGAFAQGRFLSLFYGAQQRFFNILITTLKLPSVIKHANEALADNKSVVITIVNTNEAAQNREKNKAKNLSDDEDEEEEEYDFGPKEMLVDLVRQHYPVQQFRDDVDANGKPIKVPVYRIDDDGREIPVLNPQAVAERDALIAEINRDLHLPENPLDILIQSLGGPENVAEMTGRKEYYDRSLGKFIPRGDPGAARKDVNINEQRHFMSGKKRVAVLSNAAGTGISLHASLTAKNQQPRLHITAQVGWSADKAMQMLGRTNRTNQAHPPEYLLLVSDLGGEKRFISTISKRLGSLGALTKGQKSALGGSDLMSKVNFESDQGIAATNGFYTALLRDDAVPGTDLKGLQILSDLRVLKPDPLSGALTVPIEDRFNVTRLLNRLLALDPDVQNAVYNYFYEIFTAEIQAAIENGTLDTGVRELPGDEIRITGTEEIAKDPKTGAKTFYYQVDAKTKNDLVDVKALERRMAANPSLNPRLVIDAAGKISLRMTAPPITHANGQTEPASYIVTPGNGNRVKKADKDISDLDDVKDWAADKERKAKRELDEVEGDLKWRKRSIEDDTKRHRERLQREAEQKLSNLKWRLDTAIEDAQSHLRDEIAEWEKKRDDAKTAELPADNYNIVALAKVEPKLTEAKKKYEAEKAINADPDAWAKERWQEQFEAAPKFSVAKRHLIGGAVMKYWNPIREASFIRTGIFSTTDSKTGQRIVGISIPGGRINALVARISGGASTVTPSQLHDDVLRNGTPYRLEGGIQVRRGRVGRENVIQLVPPNDDIAENLRRLGAIYERGAVPVYYLPNERTSTGDSKAMAILTRLLQQYPVEQASTEQTGTRQGGGGSVILGGGLGALQPVAEKVGEATAQFVREEVVPRALKMASGAKDLGETAVRWLNPRAGVSTDTLDKIYEMKGGRDAADYVLSQQLDKWAEKVNKMSQDEMVNFIDRQKAGVKQADPELQALSDFLRKMDDELYDEIVKYKPSLEYKENHFRVLWKVIPGSPEAKARMAGGSVKAAVKAAFQSKKPLEGGRGFLKQAKLFDMTEGIDLGGVPHTWNPIEMFKRHYADSMKFITAQKLWEDFEGMGVRKFVRTGRKGPDGFVPLDDRIARVYFPVKEGMVHHGHWWVEKGAARLLHNFLSRDLIREHAFGRFLLGVKNATTAVELSFSPFHAVFEFNESWGSEIGIGLRQIWNLGVRKGIQPQHIKEGVKTILKSPSSGVTTSLLGSKAKRVFSDWANTPEGQAWMQKNPNIRQDVMDFFQGGGKLTIEDYKNGFLTSFKEYLHSASAQDPGHYISALVRAVPALNEYAMKPLFEHYIPNLKLGFFLKEYALAQAEYADRLASGEMTRGELARKIVDSIENRFGEMNFDNLFWNRTIKTWFQIMFRSVTWKLGNIRAMSGAFAGQMKEFHRAWQKKEVPLIHPGMGWFVGLTLLTAALSSTIMTLAGLSEGKSVNDSRPRSLKDYIYPVIDHANHIRVSIPTYWRDLVHLIHGPLGYVKSSLSGEIGRIADVWTNSDFYGNEVYHPEDRIDRQAIDIIAHLLPTHFGLSSWRQAQREGGNTASKVAGTLGFSKAPKYIERTKAEELASEYGAGHREMRPRNTMAAERAQAIGGIRGIIRRGGDPKEQIDDAIRKGLITHKELPNIRKSAHTAPLAAMVKPLSVNESLNVYAAATDEERKGIRETIRKQIQNARRKPYEWDEKSRALARKYFGISPTLPPRDLAAPAGY